jgi:CMP-N-acetylneuraminic acid synthetase
MIYQILIPARSGSKRFPGKNLYPLGGLPLIAHTIKFALKSFDCDKIWVNSDDNNILEEAKKMGVCLTKRPIHLADDLTPTSEVCKFQINEFDRLGIKCDALILLQVTSPFRPDGLIEKCTSIFEKNNRDSLATFSVINKKIGEINSNFYNPINYVPGQRSQDKKNEYFENGLLYITKVKALKMNHILTENVFPFIVDDISSQVDIDYPEDMLWAEFVLNNFNILKSR